MLTTLLAMVPLAAGAAIPRSSFFGVAFGNFFSTGPVDAPAWIKEAITTLVLPELNKPHLGNMALWPGMGTSGGDLIQGLAISTVGVGRVRLNENQEDGAHVEAKPGDHVTYHCELVPPALSPCRGADCITDKHNAQTKKYDQTVSVNGKVVSRLSTDSGHALGWGTAIECQVEACGTIPQHKYINTKLTMHDKDPNYSQTVALNNAGGKLVTADGGHTWTAAVITIEKFTFT